MFNKEQNYTLRELLDTYGGQDRHGIITPAKYPYIFLIHTPGKYESDNLDYTQDGTNSVVHYSLEPNANIEKYGNKAVIEHTTRKGIYHDIYLFAKNDDNLLEYIGEYEFSKVVRANKINDDDDLNNANPYFVLNKVEENIDDEKIYIVEEVREDENLIVVSDLGKRSDRHSSNNVLIRKSIAVDFEVNEGSYIKETSTGIEVLLDSNVPISKSFVMDKVNRKISQHIWILNVQSGFIAKMNKLPPEEIVQPHNIFSYHINVGCGNAVFVVFKEGSDTKIWCFDCGIEDIPTKELDKNKPKRPQSVYVSNIEKCIRHIENKFNSGNPITINKLFLSHPHIDHYSYLLSYLENDIDELWINPYILTSGTEYLNLLNKLHKKVTRVYEPVSSSSINGINILWPDKSIIYGNKIPSRVKLAIHKSIAYVMSHKYNYISPVISVELDNKTMLVTGDIEDKSWNMFKESTKSKGFSRKTDIYCHSHHGSKTGLETKCPYNPVFNIMNCIEANHHEILMTRSGAYSGIVDSRISSSKLKRTDEYIMSKPMTFIEIEWDSMNHKKYNVMRCKNYGKRNKTITYKSR